MSQKERIIDQAMHMFVAQGIKAVRMDDIAQQLGVSKRTLYEMFGDKEELLYLAMNHYFEQNEERHRIIGEGAANLLEAMFLVIADVMDNSEAVNRMTTNLQRFYPAVYDKMLREGSEKHRLSFRRGIEKGVADGLFIADIDIELAISVLYYTVSALIVRRELLISVGVSERKAFVQIVSTFFRGIATVKGLMLIDNYMATHHPEWKNENN